MPLTLSASIKTRIESGGLGLQAFRDVLPEGNAANAAPKPPYCIIHEGIAVTPTGDNPYDKSYVAAKIEMVQIDLVQDWFDPVLKNADPPQSKLKEDPTLTNGLIALLDGCVLSPFGTNNTRVWGCKVFGKAMRLFDRDANQVRDSITLMIERDTV